VCIALLISHIKKFDTFLKGSRAAFLMYVARLRQPVQLPQSLVETPAIRSEVLATLLSINHPHQLALIGEEKRRAQIPTRLLQLITHQFKI